MGTAREEGGKPEEQWQKGFRANGRRGQKEMIATILEIEVPFISRRALAPGSKPDASAFRLISPTLIRSGDKEVDHVCWF